MGRDQEYNRFKKNKSSELKGFRHFVEWFVLKTFRGGANRLPMRVNQRIGASIGRLALKTAKKDRGIAEYQINFCFPELSESEKQDLLRRSFEHAGITLFETMLTQKIRKNPGKWIHLENDKIVHQALEEGKGLVLIFGHIGNWELLPIVYEMLDIQGITIDSPVGVGKLDEILSECRYSSNLEVIPRGDKNSAKGILTCFRNNKALLFALDQDMHVKSVFTQFFGRAASTAKGAATMAQKFKAPVIGAFGMRVEDGTHLYRFEQLSSAPYEGGDEETQQLTQSYTSAIEAQIRKKPEQWVWMHRRWKTQPSQDLPRETDAPL